ncbi:MAG TPA: hypothetical protein VGH19_14295 [Verrucomicrobiae bacterium]
MNRPIVFGFMVVCALFWTVMFVLPFVIKPSAESGEKQSTVLKDIEARRSTALGFMVISWVGVAVLRMGKSTSKSA